MKETIGKQLKKIRKERGLTQLQLWEISGITPYTISLMENDKQGTTIDTVQKLQKALNIKFDI